MDLSFSDLIEYWDIITQYINPVKIILWGALGAIIGVLAMVILLIIFRKIILVKRSHVILKVLAYAYLILLPLWSGYSFMQWFALHGCEKEIVRNIPTFLGEGNNVFNLYVKEYVTQIISERHLQLTGNEIIDKTVDYATKIVGSTFQSTPTEESDIKSKISDYFTSKFIESSFAKSIIIDEIEKNIGKPLLMDKKLTRELLDVKIQDLLDSGVITTIVTKHVNKLFGGLKINVLILFLVVLLIPVIEISIAHYLQRKRLPSPPPPIPTVKGS